MLFIQFLVYPANSKPSRRQHIDFAITPTGCSQNNVTHGSLLGSKCLNFLMFFKINVCSPQGFNCVDFLFKICFVVYF